MPSFKCKDLGMKCNFEATARTENELINMIQEHASKVHNIKSVTPDMFNKIRKAIKK